jgi:hypothetical protein
MGISGSFSRASTGDGGYEPLEEWGFIDEQAEFVDLAMHCNGETAPAKLAMTGKAVI